MGLFDKIKSAAKFITGGGATVTLEVNEPTLEEPFTVRIHAQVADADLNINRVYLKIRSVEEVTVRGVLVADGPDSDLAPERRDVSQEVETFRQEFDVSGPQELSAEKAYDWEVEISLPEGLSPTYYGQNAEHCWYFMAALDARGNDPDSGWVEATMYTD